MFGGVLVFRRIAAANMPAFETEAQVYPRVPDSQTILAAIRAGRDWSYLVKMCTLCSQDSFLYDAFLSICGFLPSMSKSELSELQTANAEAISMTTRKLVINDSEIAC